MEIPRLDAPKVIGDPIHGYVPLTDLEYDILQLPTVLRLHRIKQTATAYLTFPGSVTSRFEHLIGALFMGDKMIRQVLETLNDETYEELFPKIPKQNVLSIMQSVRLTCLLHDIGHGPFSHSAEDIMCHVTKRRQGEINEARKLFDAKDDSVIPIHEYFTYKLVTTGQIKESIERYANTQYTDLLTYVKSLLCKNGRQNSSRENPEGFKILRKIVSSQLDADRMDYLLRDGMMSGVKFGQVDVQRIILNIAVRKTKLGTYELAIHDRALGNVEDMLDARFKMHKWFYNHHVVIATNQLIENAMEKLLNDRIVDPKIFHWKSYEKGFSNDEYILTKLQEALSTRKSDYIRFLGLIDRRYIPTSLLKHHGDYRIMYDKINEYSGRRESYDAIISKLKTFFEDPKHKTELKVKFEALKQPLNKTHVFGVNVRRVPYAPFSEEDVEDKIWLYGKGEGISELTNVSTYFKQINYEWNNFPSVYLSYVIPGKTKTESKMFYDKVYDTIASEIASS